MREFAREKRHHSDLVVMPLSFIAATLKMIKVTSM